jgi:phosphatidylserine decarboxylase
MKLPRFLRPIIYGSFSKAYGINLAEMKHTDLCFYETFNKFFTRELKEGARTVTAPADATSISSPCDGRVLSCGEVGTADATIDCVKGRSYRLDEFMLGYRDESDKTVPALLKRVQDDGNKLYYMVIYLAPSDYHRFHSPAICTGDYRRHIAGYLDPVKPAYVNKHKDVFKNNERVNVFGNWSKGFFFQSFVGALNVGSIKLTFDPKLNTNQANPQEPYLYDVPYIAHQTGPLDKYLKDGFEAASVTERPADQPQVANPYSGVSLRKGETTGWFEMGSTIALIFEGPQDTQLHVHEGLKLTMGQQIVTTTKPEPNQ